MLVLIAEYKDLPQSNASVLGRNGHLDDVQPSEAVMKKELELIWPPCGCHPWGCHPWGCDCDPWDDWEAIPLEANDELVDDEFDVDEFDVDEQFDVDF